MSLFVVLLGASMFVSCNDEQETTKGDITKSSSRERSRIFEQNISTRTFAKSLAETILRSPNVLSEIHAGVQEVVNYGLDENLTVFDVLNTTMTAALFDSETIPAIIINFNDIKYAKLKSLIDLIS